MSMRSDDYSNDEKSEVPGRRGWARVNHCTARGIQEPSLEVYADGQVRGDDALDDDWASSFLVSAVAMAALAVHRRRTVLWRGGEAVDVLRFALAA